MSTEAGPVPLSGLLAAHAPDAQCLIFGDRRWTYSGLAAATDALAAEMAPVSGERVAFMLPNCPEAVTVYLACFRSGAVAAPFNTRYAPAEVEAALRRARPRWLIVHESLLGKLEEVQQEVLTGVRVLVAGSGEVPVTDRRRAPLAGRGDGLEPLAPLCASGARPTAPRPGPDRPALLFFTSGSTGPPKGVLHSQRSASAMLSSTSEAMGDVGSRDVTQVCDPLAHVSGFIETMTTLAAGGTVVLLDGFELDSFVTGLLTHRPTLICTHLDVLAQLVHAPGARGGWFSSLRGVYAGGDTFPAALQRDFRDLTGLAVGVGWGMTEAIWLTVDRTPGPDREGCVGVPVGGAEVRTDVTGELLVRGPMLMTGYWEDPRLTEDSFTGGWFRTGDLGSQDPDGAWWFEGRIKDLIVRRTSKITPGEVEAAINGHPDVAASAVVAAPDADEGQVPVAFVVPSPGRELTPEGLMAYLRERIAAYKLPARIHFLDRLPLTASGKIDHSDLRQLL